MVITRTPFRISFFGGGTDYPEYYRNNGGAVLSSAINRYCYISVRDLPPFFDHKYRIVWSKIELVNEIEEIIHPSVRECLRYMNIQEGLEIHHDGDLPARAGLGSSSSFTVGLLNALHAHKSKMISKLDLAEEAIYVEQQIIKEYVGSQDQTIAAFGGLNIIRFNSYPGAHIHLTPICMSQERMVMLQDHLMLFFTGIVRTASLIAKEQIKQTSKKKGDLTEMSAMVDEASKILSDSHDFDDFGRLLHETWLLKRNLTDKISTSSIDYIYQKARQAGAIGGKILGAGGGGFLLLYVKRENQSRVKEALGLLHVPFRFEFSGSHVIFYEPHQIK